MKRQDTTCTNSSTNEPSEESKLKGKEKKNMACTSYSTNEAHGKTELKKDVKEREDIH